MYLAIRPLFRKICRLIVCIVVLPIVLFMRLIRPWLLIRIDGLISARLGHFAANTELYLCESAQGINVPLRPYIDIFYFADKEICNKQLAKMWRRQLVIGSRILLSPISSVNKLFPGWRAHTILNDTSGRDKYNLLDKMPPHLEFTADEELFGQRGLQLMGISKGTKFVCLNVRDSAYLNAHLAHTNWESHDYRDTDIQSYCLTAEALAARGYIVVRMGVTVHQSLNSNNPRVIDYATNGMRTDFMDIYLGAKCFFAISTGSGWDSLPEMFRRPIAYVNFVPIGYLHTFRNDFLSLPQRHFSIRLSRELTLREIFSNGIGFSKNSSEYSGRDIQLIPNTPEEIRDLVIEMADRAEGLWIDRIEDEELQLRFWSLFHDCVVAANAGVHLHGEFRSRFGACFLRQNQNWLA